MRLVFDINLGDDTYAVANDIRDIVNAELGRHTNSFLLPLPDMYGSSPLIERKYKFMLYALGGNLLSDANWKKVFKTLSIGFDNPYNGFPIYEPDWWNIIYDITIGTTSSKSYDLSYPSLLQKIITRYREINGVTESEVDIEWLDIPNTDIYSENTSKIIHVDEIGSRTLVTVLYTKQIMMSILNKCDDLPIDGIKIYCVEDSVYSEDDDDDVIDYEEAV